MEIAKFEARQGNCAAFEKYISYAKEQLEKLNATLKA